MVNEPDWTAVVLAIAEALCRRGVLNLASWEVAVDGAITAAARDDNAAELVASILEIGHRVRTSCARDPLQLAKGYQTTELRD